MVKMFYASIGRMFVTTDEDGDFVLEPKRMVPPTLFLSDEVCYHAARACCRCEPGASEDDIYVHTAEIDTGE